MRSRRTRSAETQATVRERFERYSLLAMWSPGSNVQPGGGSYILEAWENGTALTTRITPAVAARVTQRQ